MKLLDYASTTYMMFPVCHEGMDIKIETSGTVYTSFTNGRPGKDSSINTDYTGDITIPSDKVQIPGFLYIAFNPSSRLEYIKVYQR